MKEKILEAISADRKEILEFTKELVSTPTENPPGKAYKECVETIASKLNGMGLEFQILEVHLVGSPMRSHPRYCILSLFGDEGKTLYFHGHYDVVPASTESQFMPYVQGGRLFGRGSADMKGGLAAMIYAIKAIKDCGIKLGGKIGLTIVPDEETGGTGGSQYLVKHGLLGQNGIGMLTAEPTSGAIWNANRGAVSVRLTVRGRSAHVGKYYQGVNAFEGMMKVANTFLKLKREVEARKTSFRIEPEDSRRSILLIGGECTGGTSFNSVPTECSFTLDRRINPEENLDEEKGRLLGVIEQVRKQGIDVEAEILQEGDSASTSEDESLANAIAESVVEITDKPASFEMCPGLLETRFYIQTGIPALAYGPGLLSVAHGPEEFVEIEKIYECAAIYALAATRLLK